VVYRRGKRPSFYFEAKQRLGYKQLCADTSDKKTAQRIEHVWSVLADQRAWDILEPVVADLAKPKKARTHTVGHLLDLYEETRGNLASMRQRLADVDIEPLVAEWTKVHAQHVEPDTAAHALAHVRYLLPTGQPKLVSSITVDWLTTRLTEYPAKRRNTHRKVHSAWSVFFDYLVMPKRIIAASPMLQVARPAIQRVLVAFYDAKTVERIIGWQPSAEREAFFALVYGTGADVSPALTIDRLTDINPATREIRIAGTKSGGRDRLVRMNETLWPIFWRHAKTIISGRIFPATWNRWTVSDWHRQTVGDGISNTHGVIERAGLRLPQRLPLRKARHHFAVRLLQAGVPVKIVADQLGSDERTVLRHYGAWIVSAEDRARWEKIAQAHQTKRSRVK